MAKDYMKERQRNQVQQRRVLKEKDKRELKKKLRPEEKRREEKILIFLGEGNFKEVGCEKIGFNLKEKDIDKRPYSNKEFLNEIFNYDDHLYFNKNHENKKYAFTSSFKYKKAKILSFYINIIISIILNLSVLNSPSYIELTINANGKSSIFFNNTISHSFCPEIPNQNFPKRISINGHQQPNISSEYELNYNDVVKLEYDYNNVNFRCYFFLCSNIKKIDFTNFNFDPSKNYDFGGFVNS